MSVSAVSPVLSLLNRYDSEGWSTTVADLIPSIHDVDKNATRIWFAFYPLDLFRALEKSEDPEKLAAFEARVAADEFIEPKDWMPEAYRRTLPSCS